MTTIVESYTLLQNVLEENEFVSKLGTSITFTEIVYLSISGKQCQLINVALFIALKEQEKENFRTAVIMFFFLKNSSKKIEFSSKI
jgi:hypothetical protein